MPRRRASIPRPDHNAAALTAAFASSGRTPVAVRSSATGEDGADASFAGMNATITNVAGEDGLVDAVLRCWTSLFSPRVITYRASRHFTTNPAMAVVVQQMIDSEKAGVAFTADPRTVPKTGWSSKARSGWARSWCPVRSSPTPTSSPRRH